MIYNSIVCSNIICLFEFEFEFEFEFKAKNKKIKNKKNKKFKFLKMDGGEWLDCKNIKTTKKCKVKCVTIN